jgi:hypothetical protein
MDRGGTAAAAGATDDDSEERALVPAPVHVAAVRRLRARLEERDGAWARALAAAQAAFAEDLAAAERRRLDEAAAAAAVVAALQEIGSDVLAASAACGPESPGVPAVAGPGIARAEAPTVGDTLPSPVKALRAAAQQFVDRARGRLAVTGADGDSASGITDVRGPAATPVMTPLSPRSLRARTPSSARRAAADTDAAAAGSTAGAERSPFAGLSLEYSDSDSDGVGRSNGQVSGTSLGGDRALLDALGLSPQPYDQRRQQRAAGGSDGSPDGGTTSAQHARRLEAALAAASHAHAALVSECARLRAESSAYEAALVQVRTDADVRAAAEVDRMAADARAAVAAAEARAAAANGTARAGAAELASVRMAFEALQQTARRLEDAAHAHGLERSLLAERAAAAEARAATADADVAAAQAAARAASAAAEAARGSEASVRVECTAAIDELRRSADAQVAALVSECSALRHALEESEHRRGVEVGSLKQDIVRVIAHAAGEIKKASTASAAYAAPAAPPATGPLAYAPLGAYAAALAPLSVSVAANAHVQSQHQQPYTDPLSHQPLHQHQHMPHQQAHRPSHLHPQPRPLPYHPPHHAAPSPALAPQFSTAAAGDHSYYGHANPVVVQRGTLNHTL